MRYFTIPAVLFSFALIGCSTDASSPFGPEGPNFSHRGNNPTMCIVDGEDGNPYIYPSFAGDCSEYGGVPYSR